MMVWVWLLRRITISIKADCCNWPVTLYRRVLEPLGYEYEIDLSQCNEAKCKLLVRRKRDNSSASPHDIPSPIKLGILDWVKARFFIIFCGFDLTLKVFMFLQFQELMWFCCQSVLSNEALVRDNILSDRQNVPVKFPDRTVCFVSATACGMT